MKRRTQIYLDEDLYRELREVAKRQDSSISRVIREKIRPAIGQPAQKVGARKFLEDLAKLGDSLDWSGAPQDLSENIDHYLYGAPKR